MKLLSTTSRIEAPFITVVIAGYAFGKYSSKTEKIVSPIDGFSKKVIEYFPNYVTSVNITKVNGTVNTYTIKLDYAVLAGDDPNKIDKILSNASSTRKLTISYGDYNSPAFIYKNEEAIITKVLQLVSMASSKISYTITAVSATKLATEGSYTFTSVRAKPSDRLKWLLKLKKYGLQDIFYGMRNAELIESLGYIASDDKEVLLSTKVNISIFEYMNYLVSCMSSISDGDDIKGRHKYVLACYDDTTGVLNGPYFKVTKVMNNVLETSSLDTYELDIGFPDVDAVVNFNINTDEGYAILYNYNEKQYQTEYVYKLNERGEFDYVIANPLLKSKTQFAPTETEKTWWALVTQYPISATVTIKGLLRPAMLMSYVKVNTVFYGRKFSGGCGLYIITKQEDTIDASGYRTTLNLTRIQGDSL